MVVVIAFSAYSIMAFDLSPTGKRGIADVLARRAWPGTASEAKSQERMRRRSPGPRTSESPGRRRSLR